MSEPERDEVKPTGELEPGRRHALTQREWRSWWCAPFLEAFARMPNAAAACRMIGISYETPKKARQRDPTFREAYEEARNVGLDFLEQVAHQRATVGAPVRTVRTRVKKDGDGKVVESETVETEEVVISDQLLVTLLKAYRPERFRERFDHRHSLDPDPDPAEEEVWRAPSRERLLELAEIARASDLPVLEGHAEDVSERANGSEPPAQ